METALRDMLQRYPDGCFEGIYVSGPWQPTRRNVLDPTSLGFYFAGSSYNPAYPLRDTASKKATSWIDDELVAIKDEEGFKTIGIDRLIELIDRCAPDPDAGFQLWDRKAIKAALEIIRNRRGDNAYLVVRRKRNLTKVRRETQGILDSGEDKLAPRDAPTLFLYRQNVTPTGELEVWWPQLRFPDGNYVLAFSFDW